MNPEATWLQLSEAALAIERGAQYIATNIDATLPKERGEYLGNGSLVAAVSHATGVVPPSSGKPEPAMYELALEKSGGKKPLVIGDRLDTDILGANRARFDSAHVLTGVTSMRQVMLADPDQRPTHQIFDLRDLSAPIEQPIFSEGGVSVGNTRVQIADQTILIDSAPLKLPDLNLR